MLLAGTNVSVARCRNSTLPVASTTATPVLAPRASAAATACSRLDRCGARNAARFLFWASAAGADRTTNIPIANNLTR